MEAVSATWRHTHMQQKASGDFLLEVETKTKYSKFIKLLLLVLDECSKVCIFVQNMLKACWNFIV